MVLGRVYEGRDLPVISYIVRYKKQDAASIEFN